jgi:hypothetical protein
MKKNYLLSFTILFVIFLSFANVIACECNLPQICVAYSRAKKVFIGKLVKVEENELLSRNIVKVHFSVEKTYKGETQKVEIVTFKNSDCLIIKFKEGEKYFVYAENANFNTYCNRTTYLSSAKKEIEHVNSLAKNKPIFNIKGVIARGDTISDDELRKIEIFVTIRNKKNKVILNEGGMFNYTVTKKGLYKINILVPFDSRITTMNDLPVFGDVRVITTSDSTLISYNLEFKPNECDFREIQIIKN